MHVPHISHSGQLGFIDQPSAASPLRILPTADLDLQDQLKVVAKNGSSSAALSSPLPMVDVNNMKGIEATETSAPPVTELQIMNQTVEGSSSSEGESFTPSLANPQLQEDTAVASGSSSSSSSELNAIERKILRLFEEGFQQSTKTNISPEVKVLGALNHACYKEYLGIIVTQLNLSSVVIPSVTSLSKSTGREKYLNEVVKAFDEIRKGKMGV